MTYRRKWGTTVWHWSPECAQWPKADLDGEEREMRPSSGQMCNDCRKLQPIEDDGLDNGRGR